MHTRLTSWGRRDPSSGGQTCRGSARKSATLWRARSAASIPRCTHFQRMLAHSRYTRSGTARTMAAPEFWIRLVAASDPSSGRKTLIKTLASTTAASGNGGASVTARGPRARDPRSRGTFRQRARSEPDADGSARGGRREHSARAAWARPLTSLWWIGATVDARCIPHPQRATGEQARVLGRPRRSGMHRVASRC